MAGKVTKALEAEALSTNVTFKHNGVTYTVPAMDEWEHEALLAVENNRIGTLVESVLGDQLAKFKATKPKVKDTVALAEALLIAAGTNLGNSED